MIKFLCYICFFAILVSCNKSYSLQGSTDNFRNGSRVYLKIENSEGWNVFDSCDIVHGKFVMKGCVDTPFVASLFIGDEAVMPIVVEQGEILVDMSVNDVEIGGTQLNDMLSDFINNKTVIENRMTEIERWETNLILDGHTSAAATAMVRDSLAKVGYDMDNYVENFIKEHYRTPLGPCVFRLLCSTLPYPLITKQIERILSDAPDEFKSDYFVKDFIIVAHANMRMINRE